MTKSRTDTHFNEEREQMHRQLLSAVSHDLKTPLASVIGSLEIHQRLHERLSEEKKQTLIETALQEAYRLDNFITNMLDMHKLEQGLVTMRREHFELGALIRDCLVSLDNRLTGSSVTLDAPAQPVEITSDAALLGRALALLLDNAVKYGGTPPAIIIRYERTDSGLIQIELQDNGQGIPAGHAEHIFEKYTRFARGDHQNAGTGLGLSIARAIMQLLGGTVRVAPSHGGACLILEFPSGA